MFEINEILQSMDTVNNEKILFLAKYFRKNKLYIVTNDKGQVIFEKINPNEMICFVFTSLEQFESSNKLHKNVTEIDFDKLVSLIYAKSKLMKLVVFNTFEPKKIGQLYADIDILLILNNMIVKEEKGYEINKTIRDYNKNTLKEKKEKYKLAFAKAIACYEFFSIKSSLNGFIIETEDEKTYVRLFTNLEKLVENETIKNQTYEIIGYEEAVRIVKEMKYDGIQINNKELDGITLSLEDIDKFYYLIKNEIGNFKLVESIKNLINQGVTSITEDVLNKDLLETTSLILDSEIFIITEENEIQCFLEGKDTKKVLLPLFTDLMELLKAININELKKNPDIKRVKCSSLLMQLLQSDFKEDIIINPMAEKFIINNKIIKIMAQQSLVD